MPWLELDAQARRLFSLLILQALMVTDSRDSWSVCKDSLAHIDNGNGHAYAEKEEYEAWYNRTYSFIGRHVGIHSDANIQPMTKLQNPSSVCNEIGTCACALEDLKMLQPIRHDKCSLAMYRDHRAFEKRRRKFEKTQIREKRRKKKNPKPLKELFRAGYTWLHHDLPELKRAVLSMQRNMTKVLDAAFARRGADNMGSVVVVNPLVLSEDFYRLIVQHECLASIIKGYLGPSAQLDDAFLQRNIPRQLTPEEKQKAWVSSAQWHHDTVGHRLKMFVYLSDVDASTATPVCSGTHRLLYKAGYHGGGHGFEQENGLSRFDDRYVHSTFDVHRLVGSSGDAFLFDTNSIHRAAAVTSGQTSRDVLVLEFSCKELSAEIKDTCRHHAPTGPLNFSRKRYAAKCLAKRCKSWRWLVPRTFEKYVGGLANPEILTSNHGYFDGFDLRRQLPVA